MWELENSKRTAEVSRRIRMMGLVAVLFDELSLEGGERSDGQVRKVREEC
jgi:hypothetical protein